MIWVLMLSFIRMTFIKLGLKHNKPKIELSSDPKAPKSILEKHYRRPIERPFLKEEVCKTKLLVGGLTNTHDRLIAASLNNLGLKVEALPPSNLSSFEKGREFGNNGYCNPTYFTVGNLINYLRILETSGLSKKQIIEKYAFLTAGCNAPCRFGLIEIEYRMALKEAGYSGFRVLVFKKEEGINQKIKGLGIEINPTFFLALVNAINLADVLIGYTNEIRPLEVKSGITDSLKEKATKVLENHLIDYPRVGFSPFWQNIIQLMGYEKLAFNILTFYRQLFSKRNENILAQLSEQFEQIEIDPLKSKTRVKITGELWAGTTEGDGNFKMHNFLESEGATIIIEPVATYVHFMIHKHILRHKRRKEVILSHGNQNWYGILNRVKNHWFYYKKLAILELGSYAYHREYRRLILSLGGFNHDILNQPTLQKLAHPYYNTHIEGGEGFMEVAKNIYYHKHAKCHMVLSLKPFGCMPSTQSDGVQSAVIEKNSDMIFLPIETSGEGRTNAHNRVLMALSEAKAKAKRELESVTGRLNHDLTEIRSYLQNHPELRRAGYTFPKQQGVANQAANFLLHVDQLIS